MQMFCSLTVIASLLAIIFILTRPQADWARFVSGSRAAS
jgi:hypothetical protein